MQFLVLLRVFDFFSGIKITPMHVSDIIDIRP